MKSLVIKACSVEMLFVFRFHSVIRVCGINELSEHGQCLIKYYFD